MSLKSKARPAPLPVGQYLLPVLRTVTTHLRTVYGLFVVVALIAGVTLALVIPYGAGNDEQAHVFRAYNVSRGVLVSIQKGILKGHRMYGGPVARSLYFLEAHVAWAKDRRCDANLCTRPSPAYQADTNSLASQPLRAAGLKGASPRGAAGYFFLAYVPAATAFGLAWLANINAGHTLLLARLFSLFAYIVVVTFALYILRRSAARWIAITVALMPISLVAAASVTADMFIIAGSLLFFALMVRAAFDGKLSKLFTVLLTVMAVALPLTKLPYVILSLAALCLPIFPKGIRGHAWRTALALAIIVPSLVWLGVTQDMNQTQSALTHAGSSIPSMSQQVGYVVKHPFTFVQTFFHSFVEREWIWIVGTPLTNNQAVPIAKGLVIALYAVILAAAAAAGRELRLLENRRWTAVLFAATGAVLIGGIAVALYSLYTPVGSPIIEGVEGRYIVPALPFLFFGLSGLIKLKLPALQYWRALLVGASVLVLFATIWWYYAEVYVWSVVHISS